MIPKLQFGEFYGLKRQQFKTTAFVFTKVESQVKKQVPIHTHENAHFLFVMKGEYEASVRNKKQSYSSPTVLYYPAGTTHSDRFQTTGGKFLTVSLTPETNEVLLEGVNFFDYSKDFLHPEISLLGTRISGELQSPDHLSSIVLEALASELLGFAIRSRASRAIKPPSWLKRAYELLNDRCNQDITVAEIAVTVGVHPLHLARTFRKFFNCSPGEYLRKRRIELASDLLQNSKKTLVEIALACGFADQSQFTRSFKQITGTTPSDFRRINKF